MAPDWAAALAPVEPTIRRIGDTLREQSSSGKRWLPAPDAVLRAFSRPMSEVRVLIVGQDPYPTPGHAMGLAFSVASDVRPLPRSLENIFRELNTDLGCNIAPHGDLTRWADQGVLLLNRVLTVESGSSASHRDIGWQEVTSRAVTALHERGGPLVSVLWGNQAQEVRSLLGGVPVVASPHPSPLSASRGFFGSRPFSRVNALLAEQGADPVLWCPACPHPQVPANA
jgi:uracil-DNA glycosylase